VRRCSIKPVRPAGCSYRTINLISFTARRNRSTTLDGDTLTQGWGYRDDQAGDVAVRGMGRTRLSGSSSSPNPAGGNFAAAGATTTSLATVTLFRSTSADHMSGGRQGLRFEKLQLRPAN